MTNVICSLVFVLGFQNPLQRSRAKRMNANQGATLFEFREKRDEFVPSPHSGVS